MSKKKNEQGAVPCGICGSYPSVYEFSGEYRHCDDGTWDIECGGCAIQVRMNWTKEGAIKGWNSMMENVFEIEPGVLTSIRTLVDHAKGKNIPGLDLIVAKNVVSKFLEENTHDVDNTH